MEDGAGRDLPRAKGGDDSITTGTVITGGRPAGPVSHVTLVTSVFGSSSESTILLFDILLCAQLNPLVPAGSVWPARRWRNTSSSASGRM